VSHLPRSVAAALLGVVAAQLISAPAHVLAEDAGPVHSASLAVVLLTLPHSGALQVTRAQEDDLYFGPDRSVATFYRDASNGTFTLTGSVFGPFAVDVDDRFCAVSDWAAAANDAAAKAGDDLSGYDYQAYVFPRMQVCPWSGLATTGGTQSFINNPALGDAGLYHAAHELGHDLGADHAHSLICRVDGDPVSIGTSDECRRDEYGDPFTVMGSGIVTLPSGWERHQMGILPDSSTVVVDTPGTATYRLSVVDDTNSSPRLLLIRRGDGTSLAVEYRRPRGSFDTLRPADPAVRGVMVRLAGRNGSASLLDANPGTATFADAQLRAGKSLADPDGGVSITVEAAGPDAARVEVTVVDRSGASPDTTAPLPPTGLEASSSNIAVTLRWQPALDNVGVVSYRILRDGDRVASVETTDFVDGHATSGSPEYVIQAIDGAGNVSAEEVMQVDRTPPTAPSAIRWRRVTSGSIRVSWSASSDDDRVAGYLVRIDSRAAVRTRYLTVALRGVDRSRHLLRVWAVDRTGNQSRAGSLTIGR
jgi:hypothetical protein